MGVKPIRMSANGIAYSLEYENRNQTFMIDQLYLMLLTKIKEIIDINENNKIRDNKSDDFDDFESEKSKGVVIIDDEEKDTEIDILKGIIIAVPSYFNESTRIMIMEYCNLIGLKCNEIIPSYLSTSINFGFRNFDNFIKEHYCLIIDIGSSYSNCTIVKYIHNNNNNNNNSETESEKEEKNVYSILYIYHYYFIIFRMKLK